MLYVVNMATGISDRRTWLRGICCCCVIVLIMTETLTVLKTWWHVGETGPSVSLASLLVQSADVETFPLFFSAPGSENPLLLVVSWLWSTSPADWQARLARFLLPSFDVNLPHAEPGGLTNGAAARGWRWGWGEEPRLPALGQQWARKPTGLGRSSDLTSDTF